MRTIVVLLVILIPNLLFAETVDEVSEIEKFEQPVLLTSSGQAADIMIMKGLCMRSGIEIRYMPNATSDSLMDCRTLLLVAGGSSKGLGAAKVDPKQEEDRVKELVKAAKKAKIPVVTFHIGGDARRGVLSDPFNKLAAEPADMLVVVSGGDKDDFFRNIATSEKSDYVGIDKQIDVIGVLKKYFGKAEKTE